MSKKRGSNKQQNRREQRDQQPLHDTQDFDGERARGNFRLKTVTPRSENQKRLFGAWKGGAQVVVAKGCAGTGKTFLATYLALNELHQPNTAFQKIIFFRSAVPVREQGFLKGDKDEKEAPYAAVFRDAVNKLSAGRPQWEPMVRSGKIEFHTTSFERGSTYDNAIVIIDESQNLNFDELNMLITRGGKGTRYLFLGDTAQDDLRHSKFDTSGFPYFLRIVDRMPSRAVVTFEIADIQRGEVVGDYLIARAQVEKEESVSTPDPQPLTLYGAPAEVNTPVKAKWESIIKRH